MKRFIEAHGERFGVEPICETLAVAPSTYYAARSRPPSARAQSDATLKPELTRVNAENFDVYGAYKMWRQLNREGFGVGRDRIARLMREMGLVGLKLGRVKRTTIPALVAARPGDLVERHFFADAPNQLWVADLTYVPTWSGFAYTSLITDAFSRRIVGWRVSSSLRSDLALDALDMAIWNRRGADLSGLVHHSDRGVQFLSIRYTERLAEAGAVASVGTRGDSYDNALAESVNSRYKGECIRKQGPWRTVEDVEIATLRWVDWWNNRRLHGACNDIPPAEFEDTYYANQAAVPAA
jgi:putative transposase